ncbi:MAG: O-antigen ligase family protein [Patescibacteria group bacterium]
MRISRLPLARFAESAVLGLVLFSILFRGGKSLEATWILTGIAGAVTFALWVRIHKGEMKSRMLPDALWMPAILFVVWTFVSFAFSTTKNYGLDEVLRDSSLVLLFLWILRMGGSQSEDRFSFLHKLIFALLIATVLSCFVGITVYVFQPVNRFVGTFFDPRFHTDYWPNAWAEYLLLVWPLFLWFSLRVKQVKPYFARLALLGFVLGCLFLSYSRGALISFIGQIVLFCIILWRSGAAGFLFLRGESEGEGLQMERIKKILFGAGFTILVALSAFFFINSLRNDYYPVESVGEKVTFSADEGGSSVSERRQFWGQAFTLSLARPLVGWGPYSFRFVQPQYQEDVLATSDHPHNVFLKLAAERGIPAAVFFAFLVLYVIENSFARLLFFSRPPHPDPLPLLESEPRSRRPGEGNVSQSFLPYIFVGVAGVLAHNLIDYNLQFVGIAVPFWLMLGILARDSASRSRVPLFAARFLELFLTILLLVIAISEGRYLILSSIGRHAEAAGRGDDALVWYLRSANEVFSRDLRLSTAHLLTRRGRYVEAHAALDRSLAQNEEDARGWKLLGELALIERDMPLAIRSYEQAYHSAKWNDLSVVSGLLQAFDKAGDSQSIGARKPEVDHLLESYAKAIVANTHFIALGPNVESFLELANGLATMYPDEAPHYQILGARIDRHAKTERDKLKARVPGYLW